MGQLEEYQTAAKLSGWIAAWQEMLRHVEAALASAGRYDDTRHLVIMRDLCTSQLFMSGAPGGVAPGKLSPEITTLGGNMTISVSVSAHAADKEQEAEMLNALRETAAKLGEFGEVYTASASTSHHGTVDLKVADPGVAADAG